jgi:hypothetical protein
MALTVAGNTVLLQPAGGATANVANIATRTNTFHITNASSTVYAYVGIFPNYAQAIIMDHPAVGADGGGTILAPNESMTMIGNWGVQAMATMANVYVSAITATGVTNVFITPVVPGSDA